MLRGARSCSRPERGCRVGVVAGRRRRESGAQRLTSSWCARDHVHGRFSQCDLLRGHSLDLPPDEAPARELSANPFEELGDGIRVGAIRVQIRLVLGREQIQVLIRPDNELLADAVGSPRSPYGGASKSRARTRSVHAPDRGGQQFDWTTRAWAPPRTFRSFGSRRNGPAARYLGWPVDREAGGKFERCRSLATSPT